MKIIIATGGSGGHVFPALSVAIELRSRGHEIVFLGTPGLAAEKIEKNNFRFVGLCAKGIAYRSLASFFVSINCMLTATGQALRFLKEFKPDVVAGFGGYGAFPTVAAAFLLRCPTLIHEQNVVPGKANYLLSKFSKRVAVSFAESRRYFNQKKVVLTGCPCRKKPNELPREEILRKFNLSPDKPIILIVGGSQGSRRINKDFFEAAILLKESLDFQIIHISGKKDYEDLKASYERSGMHFCLFDFLDEIDLAYMASDLVICRAGAMTINEVALFRLPAVLIPYPFAGGHQKENAKVLCRAQIAQMIEEHELTPERLRAVILELLTRRIKKEEIALRAEKFFYADSAIRLANEIELIKE
ncbi:MAG: undecaprenyldiphospho-muramoylpentapeptide beta-N-acetylglucosaminyltransferase [Candidatus Omnitrophota bacterium]